MDNTLRVLPWKLEPDSRIRVGWAPSHWLFLTDVFGSKTPSFPRKLRVLKLEIGIGFGESDRFPCRGPIFRRHDGDMCKFQLKTEHKNYGEVAVGWFMMEDNIHFFSLKYGATLEIRKTKDKRFKCQDLIGWDIDFFPLDSNFDHLMGFLWPLWSPSISSPLNFLVFVGSEMSVPMISTDLSWPPRLGRWNPLEVRSPQMIGRGILTWMFLLNGSSKNMVIWGSIRIYHIYQVIQAMTFWSPI